MSLPEQKEDGTGKVWNQTPLVNLLTNYAYVGDYLSNKETVVFVDGEARRRKNRGEADQYYISAHHEAIISHELFDCVQELVKNHTLFVKRSNFSEYEKQLLKRAKLLAKEEFHGKIYFD